MATVSYSVSLPYRAVGAMGGVQPAAEVKLFNGDMSTSTVGILDSGSPFTVFSNEIAELIGIDDVTVGARQPVKTFGGSIDIYLFDLELQLTATGKKIPGQIGFFNARAPRNILGRIVIFSAFQLGFHESASTVHLQPE